MKTPIKLSWYIAFSILLSVYCTYNFAQTTRLQKAQKAAANFEYSKAIELYTDYFNTTSAKPEEIRELVNCYSMVGDTKSAESWMLKLISSKDSNNVDILTYAKILKSNGKYDEAKKEFLKYFELEPSDKGKVTKWIASCQKSIERMGDDSIFFEVKNLSSLNTNNSEFGLIKIGNEFIFTSDRYNKASGNNEICEWTGNPYYKIYSTNGNIDGTLASDPVLIDSLNSTYHNGQAAYDSIHKIIYFTRTKLIKVTEEPINNDPTYFHNNYDVSGYENQLEIYSANYDNGKWENIKPFEYNNPQYSVGHPALSTDGKILYFVSDMPGGYGGDDIYYCEALPNGKWNAPVNAGNTINTEGKEVFPYIDKEGTLYFASDNPSGMGGLDLYKSKGSKNKWSKPVNLGYPINSSKDDFSIFVTDPGKSGYFSSNRDGGKGEDDIYSFSLIKNKKRILYVRTLELLKDNSLAGLKNAPVTIRNDEKKYTKSLTSNNKGECFDVIDLPYVIDLPTSYDVSMMKSGYYPKSKTIKVKKTDGDTLYVELVTNKATESIVFNGKIEEQVEKNINLLIADAKIAIKNVEKHSTDTIKSDSTGKFSLNMDFNKTYLFTVTKEGYYTQSKKITAKYETGKDSVKIETVNYGMNNNALSENKTVNEIALGDNINDEIFLNKIIINKSVIVNNIYYDFNKWNIRPDAAKELDKIVDMLKKNPNISIELSSHTDSRGSDAINNRLSQKRAESAANYIISKGIDAKRITAKGYGKTKLLNKCVKCTDEEHQMNRRTEFKVISIGK
ncbi:MAG: OmpA family protein [Bacteroidales bacterium]|jgi:outer membrane protein OmpA-like peptidoglycan-associated protein/tetratricopeptide (TPR) repeat protein